MTPTRDRHQGREGPAGAERGQRSRRRAQAQADGRPAEQARDAPPGARDRSGPLRAKRRREHQCSEDHGNQEGGDGQDGGFDVDGPRRTDPLGEATRDEILEQQGYPEGTAGPEEHDDETGELHRPTQVARAEAGRPEGGDVVRPDPSHSGEQEPDRRDRCQTRDDGERDVAVALELQRVDDERGAGRRAVHELDLGRREAVVHSAHECVHVDPVVTDDRDRGPDDLRSQLRFQLVQLCAPRLGQGRRGEGQRRGGPEGEVDRQHADPGDRHPLADEAQWVDEVEPRTEVEPADGDELPVDDDLVRLAGVGGPPAQEPRVPHARRTGAQPQDHTPEEVLLAPVGHEVAVGNRRRGADAFQPTGPVRDLAGGVDGGDVEQEILAAPVVPQVLPRGAGADRAQPREDDEAERRARRGGPRPGGRRPDLVPTRA